ncbi:MAG: hypothetical protein JWO99_232 [Candidatus Saccharibacteria bacterium]|nr:hypothetical protein [Candidatus Saccharibacteria bacterium]
MALDTQVPSRNLEERKELRLHSFNVKRQGGWFIGCLFVALSLISLDSSVTKIVGVGVIGIGLLGARKFQDGLGYRIMLVIVGSLRHRAKAKGVTSIEQLRVTEKAPIDISAMSYPAVDDEGRSFRIGVFYNPEDNCDTFVVVGSGVKHPGADALDLMRQEDLYIDGIAEVLANYDGRVGVALPYISRPVNMLRQELWEGLNLDPAVLDAEPFDSDDDFLYANASVEERQATALMQSRAAAELYEADVVRAVAMTVPRPSSWPKVKNGLIGGSLTPEQLEEAPVVKLALLLESELRSRGIEDAAILDRIDIAKYVRSGWDMVNIQDWYVQLETADPLNNPDVISEGLDEWPSHEIVTGKSRRGGYYSQTDGTFHRPLQAKRFLTSEAAVGEFDQIFDTHDLGFPRDVGIAVTLCGDAVNPYTERNLLRRQMVIQSAVQNQKKGESLETDEDYERSQNKKRRESALYRSKSIALSYNVFVVVSATSLKALDVATEKVIKRAKRNHIALRTVKWELRQIRALFTTLLGVSMFN